LGGTTSQPNSGGATVLGGNSSPAGGSMAGGATGAGGSAALGGTTSQPGTGGATVVGGRPGRDGGPATGGAAGGSTVVAGDGGLTPAGTSAGCGKAPTAITSSQYNNGTTIPITVNGSQRRYILNVPTNYDNTKPYKFILAVHELNGNDKEMYNQKYYDLLPLSNNTVIFAAPNGVNGSTPCSGTGSGDSGCGWPAGNNNMALMDAVVKQVTDNFCVDTNHIFATGWSYGASMSYEIGCERPLGGPTATATWGVRAVANYSVAQMSGSCKPSTSYPVAYYLSHGTHDSVLGYSGGVTLAQNWSNADGCTWQTPTSVTSGAHVCTKMAGCKAGYPVEFCSFNGDHTPYPDSGNESSSWGPQEVWTFFSQF
jgi:poly(3-hydroxybutyrate) depolymerase